MPSLTPPLTAWQSVRAWLGRVRRHQPPPRPEMRVTALTYATFFGDPAPVTALLDKGAEVDARSDDLPPTACAPGIFVSMSTPGPCYLSLLEDKERDSLLPPHTKGTAGVTALMVASGDISDARDDRLLLDRGADVNAKDEEGDTALMNAAARFTLDTGTNPSSSDLDTLQLLLDRGADVNARDRWGRTALMLAAEAQSPDAIKLLLARGADATRKDAGGQTAYTRAAKKNLAAELRILRRHGITR